MLPSIERDCPVLPGALQPDRPGLQGQQQLGKTVPGALISQFARFIKLGTGD